MTVEQALRGLLTQLLRLSGGGLRGESMTVVKDLVAELAKRNIRGEFIGTGGGCMAVEVRFGESLPGDDYYTRYHLLVTDRDDVFTRSDWFEDDDVSGFYVGFYANNDQGDYVTEGVTVYETSQDAGVAPSVAADALVGEPFKVTDFAVEIARCADAVEFIVRAVEAAEFAAVVDASRGGRDR